MIQPNEEKLKQKVKALKSNDNEIIGFKCNLLNEENIRNVNKTNIEKVQPD